MQEEVKRLREEIEELNTSIKYVTFLRYIKETQTLKPLTLFFFSPVSASLQLMSRTATPNRGAH